MQIFADAFGVPVWRNKLNNSASVGCAINAGMAIGVFDSYEEAIQKMVRTGDGIRPNPNNTKFYHRLDDRVYKQAHKHFDPILKELSPLVGELA